MVHDHLYDFVPPSAPWEPVGDAAQRAGWSLSVVSPVGGVLTLLVWAFVPPALVVRFAFAARGVAVAAAFGGRSGAHEGAAGRPASSAIEVSSGESRRD